jgi:hypothetical protein
MRKGVRVTATALCQWERTPQGSLRATWRPGWRVAPSAADAERSPEAAVRLARARQQLRALSSSTATARERRIDRWIPGAFIAALYLVIAFVEIVILVRA